MSSQQQKQFQLDCDASKLAGFRESLRDWLTEKGFPEKTVGEVVLAVDEAITNAIRHSYEGKPGVIEVVLSDFPDRAEILIEDFGKKFDPRTLPPPTLPPTKGGGLGRFLIKKFMDEVNYEETSNGNRHLLIKFKV